MRLTSYRRQNEAETAERRTIQAPAVRLQPFQQLLRWSGQHRPISVNRAVAQASKKNDMGAAKRKRQNRVPTVYHHTSTLRTNLIWMSGVIEVEGK